MFEDKRTRQAKNNIINFLACKPDIRNILSYPFISYPILSYPKYPILLHRIILFEYLRGNVSVLMVPVCSRTSIDIKQNDKVLDVFKLLKQSALYIQSGPQIALTTFWLSSVRSVLVKYRTDVFTSTDRAS